MSNSSYNTCTNNANPTESANMDEGKPSINGHKARRQPAASAEPVIGQWRILPSVYDSAGDRFQGMTTEEEYTARLSEGWELQDRIAALSEELCPYLLEPLADLVDAIGVGRDVEGKLVCRAPDMDADHAQTSESGMSPLGSDRPRIRRRAVLERVESRPLTRAERKSRSGNGRGWSRSLLERLDREDKRAMIAARQGQGAENAAAR